jgi:ABC-type phosphate/phosphonate transport system permease subunit
MKKQNPALIYGLIGAAILILIGFGIQMYFMSMMQKAVANGDSINPMKFLTTSIISFLLVAAVFIICIVKAMKDYRKINPDYNYKKLAGQGLLTTLIISLVSTAFSILYSQVIDPGATQKSKDLSIQVIENMNMPDAQKEKQLDRIRDQNPVSQAITGTAITLFCGLIVSLIAASVLNKKGKEFPENPHNLS